MAAFVHIPPSALAADTLDALLEEFASRDGTDYGERETPMASRVAQLRTRLLSGEIQLLFDGDSETWDLLPADQARELLGEPGEVTPS